MSDERIREVQERRRSGAAGTHGKDTDRYNDERKALNQEDIDNVGEHPLYRDVPRPLTEAEQERWDRVRQWRTGDRVELVWCTDEHTRLVPGTRGTVSFIDDLGTVFVTWDDGSCLGMVAEAGDIIRKAENDSREQLPQDSPGTDGGDRDEIHPDAPGDPAGCSQ